MNNIRLSIVAIIMVVVLGSCKKSFLDINKDPNNATESSITPDLALAAQLSASAGRNASTYDFLQRYMGYWSASGTYSRATVEMSYNINNDFGAGIFSGIYYTVSQYRSIGRKAADLDWKFYKGITQIMEAHEMAVLVDLYGDVPYSTAFDLVGNIRPTYDKGEDIYKSLLPKIDTGLANIKAATGNDLNIATQDIMFKGNKTNWAKFANTLKLRLLLHTYKVSTFNIPAEVAKIVAEGSGFLGNGLSASVQPGYSPDKPNPFYNAHLFLITGAEADNYNRANNFSLNLMQSLNDPRVSKVYRPSKLGPSNNFRGTDYGSDPIAVNSSDNTSGPGYGLAPTASSPMWLMTSVEAMFLRAEAVTRGYLTGDAKTVYEDAVRESFTYLGLTTANANAYLAQSDSRIAWPAAGALQDKIAVIAWQKYFGLNGLQPNETFTDFRRLGVVQPTLSIAPERGNNQIIRRLLYPTTEYSYNAANVASQGTITPYTPRVFWDK
ncbi:MAG TPA: SusD/RagB family nutrient-binding outer membrane lipoprotein [Chitinophagaceae bacterium]|nr:SusD/RagB family nutrient-binding outer membrane lipoprotein [Chitinophagaceae bacterium]